MRSPSHSLNLVYEHLISPTRYFLDVSCVDRAKAVSSPPSWLQLCQTDFQSAALGPTLLISQRVRDRCDRRKRSLLNGLFVSSRWVSALDWGTPWTVCNDLKSSPASHLCFECAREVGLRDLIDRLARWRSEWIDGWWGGCAWNCMEGMRVCVLFRANALYHRHVIFPCTTAYRSSYNCIPSNEWKGQHTLPVGFELPNRRLFSSAIGKITCRCSGCLKIHFTWS